MRKLQSTRMEMITSSGLNTTRKFVLTMLAACIEQYPGEVLDDVLLKKAIKQFKRDEIRFNKLYRS